MKRNGFGLVWGGVMLLGAAVLARAWTDDLQPLTFPLGCESTACELLKGEPQTRGMRSGSVKLRTGESVGWHSTAGYEETLTILQGSGVVKLAGQKDLALQEKTLVYIPPNTRHNVTNTGSEVLAYVWVVAPVK